MQKNKFNVEEKRNKVLMFPGQKPARTQSQMIQYISKQDGQMNTAFFMSLISLEPHLQTSMTYELVETLVKSYQMIIENMDKEEGLQLYFQHRLNQLLAMPQVVKLIVERKKLGQQVDDALLKMIQGPQGPQELQGPPSSRTLSMGSYEPPIEVSKKESYQSIDVQIIEEMEYPQPRRRQNSLVSYLNMQQKLKEEEEKAKKIMEEFDASQQAVDKVIEKELAEQSKSMESRLLMRGKQKVEKNLNAIQENIEDDQ